ncbi:tRNA uridine-5-carboxymethylaminomethyl(34) synthesis GTPase MnmE [Paraneptunicella aestuarii]|uniref:tRNA uridine-5-carboxymethylaminomethyl(34) synthesis GTPase MnmE n=1 Tax=Paraneptunicella aestuarii TaxID=2831148 RepID=UPI001E36A62C|nr:tRNA uridine-5-carboxymethylaminomethyl(34) synthesis GTPase MnmE [Paraneptunicella aestuarii]UAA38795.1 tRNA uridine-5-carboxymethylaminomethyl(34) synthesis GTPase MnmE [Paraneptunicella aestuarii]
MADTHLDTIAAQATAPGRAGVGIIRVSGSKVPEVAQAILGYLPIPRHADYTEFTDEQNNLIDQGIAIYFKAPHSFTGEDVLEFQGHGGPVILDMLLKHIANVPGVRLANPGEFSERAFLNDKLDLAQAEAISDLINASSEQAAKSALLSMKGEFSKQVNELVEQVTLLRMYVEAAIDFPEEEIDFLADDKIKDDLATIVSKLEHTLQQAKQGSLLREGMHVVIAGKPNAGKSSLLNALAGYDAAIVTDIEGTTRDVLKEHIHIDGMPLHIIDTAGLRESPDKVEQIGIERAWQEMNNADLILLIQDSTSTSIDEKIEIPAFGGQQSDSLPDITVIRNKADLSNEPIGVTEQQGYPVITLSVKDQSGIEQLREHLKQRMGYSGSNEGQFMARRRHIDALLSAQEHVLIGQEQLLATMAGELLAEELRLAQQSLSEITGEFSSDDLLGRIFSSFCIGK